METTQHSNLYTYRKLSYYRCCLYIAGFSKDIWVLIENLLILEHVDPTFFLAVCISEADNVVKIS